MASGRSRPLRKDAIVLFGNGNDRVSERERQLRQHEHDGLASVRIGNLARGRRHGCRGLAAQLEGLLTAGARTLDFGCGSGEFIGAMLAPQTSPDGAELPFWPLLALGALLGLLLLVSRVPAVRLAVDELRGELAVRGGHGEHLHAADLDR